MSDIARKKENSIKIIRSLLISSPSGLTPRQLERDYQSVQNEKLPYRKFGHTDLLSFIKTMTDVVRIDFRHREIYLYGIADEKTKHIKSMIDHQRKTSKYMGLSKQIVPPRRPKSTSIAARRVGHASASVQRNIFNVVQTYDKGISLPNFMNLYRQEIGVILNAERLGFRRLPDLFLSMPDVCRLEYGRRDIHGNDLYLYPAKVLKEPKVSFSQTIRPLLEKNRVKNEAKNNVTNAKTLQHNGEEISRNYDNKIKDVVNSEQSNVNTQNKEIIQKDSDFKISVPPSCQLLKKEILEILDDEPKGIWAVRVPILYKKKFGKELEIQKLGYFSIIEFLATLSDQISITRPNPKGDWLLSRRCENGNEPNQALFDSYLNEGLQITKMEVTEMLIKSKDGILLDKLFETYEKIFRHKIHLDDFEINTPAAVGLALLVNGVCIYEKDGKVYVTLTEDAKKAMQGGYQSPKKNGENESPIDAVGPHSSYKSPPLPSSDTEYVDVFVSDVTNPGYFTVQLCGKKTTGSLNRLMDELERFYCSSEGDRYKIPPCMVTIGQICTAVFMEDLNWHRAVIVRINKASYVDVLYVDYGSIAAVPVASLRLLKSSFMQLPSQMIRARLAHIQPTNLTSWTLESRNTMLDMSRDRPLVALITSIEDRVLSLCLCDTSQPDTDIHINDILVEKNHAVYFPDDLTKQQGNTLRSFMLQQIELDGKVISDIPGLNVANFSLDVSQSDSGTPGAATRAASISGLSDNNGSQNDSAKPYQKKNSGTGIKIDKALLFESHPPTVQKTFIQKHQIIDGKYSIHVINYEGNAMVSSAEISLLFQQSTDVLVPLLLMKNLRFTELVVGNDEKHSQLFNQMQEQKVPGAIDRNVARNMVCLYRLQDIPAMINGIGHKQENRLIQNIVKIAANFDPDSKYWISKNPLTEDDVQSKLEQKELDALISERDDLFCKRKTLLEQLGTESSPRTVDKIFAIEKEICFIEAKINKRSATNPKQLGVDSDVNSVHNIMMNQYRSETASEKEQSEGNNIIPKSITKVAEVTPFVQNENIHDKFEVDLAAIPGAQMPHNIVDFSPNINNIPVSSMDQPPPLMNGNSGATWSASQRNQMVLNQGNQIQSGIFIPGGISGAFQGPSIDLNYVPNQGRNRTQAQVPVVPTHWNCLAMPPQPQIVERSRNTPQFFQQPPGQVFYNQIARQPSPALGSQIVFASQNPGVRLQPTQYSLFLPTRAMP